MERLAERVLTLERQLQGLQAEVLTASARVAETPSLNPLRIAKIDGEPSPNDNTFPIIFLDGTFTESAGSQSVDWEDRQNEARAYARTIDGGNIDGGERVVVMAWNNRWWIVSSVSSGGELIVVKASEDIEHNEYGVIELQETVGDDFRDDLLQGTGGEYFAYNPLPKVWKNSRMLVSTTKLIGTDNVDNIVQAWSATRIRGKAYSPISAGEWGAISDILPIDGHFDAETATAYLPTATVDVSAGAVVWAELRFDSVSGVSNWEIYSADCS